MQVGIIKSRNHSVTFQINHLRTVSSKTHYLIVRSRGENFSILDGHGVSLRAVTVEGMYFSVGQNQ